MTTKKVRLWMAVLGVAFFATQVCAAEGPALKTEKEKMSYAIGTEMGGNLKRFGMNLDMDLLAKGLRDAYTGSPLIMTPSDIRMVMQVYYNDIRQNQSRVMKLEGEANKKEGDAFLAENKKKEGVVTLPSGLQYKILKAGTGQIPTESAMVEVNYHGALINGTEFDSSYPTGKPAVFAIGGVIKGWQEALMMMPVGSKWMLYIPPELAYGERAAGHDIGPNATLIFELELVGIQ